MANKRFLTPLVAVLLAASTLAVYWQLGASEFIEWDDNIYIFENARVMQGLSWDGAKWAFTTFHSCNWHPLTWLSHMLDVQMFGERAGGHHLVSLGFHICNVLLLFGFLKYATGRLWASAIVAGFFALHPLHVESVAWVAERKDVLSTFFWMATILAYAHYARKPGIARYFFVAGLFAMGLMAKPMLVTLPLVLLLLDYWPLGRIGFEGRWPRRVAVLVLEKLPLAIMSAGSVVMTLAAQWRTIAPTSAVPLTIRWTNAVVSYGRYIGKMFWPAGLAMHYPYPRNPLYAQAAVVLVLLVAATAIAIRFGSQRRYAIIGWLWYLITLLPVIGFVQVGMQSHADRYTYVPLTGLFIMIAWGAADVAAARPGLKAVLSVAAMALLAAAGAHTWRTVAYWRDDVTLFSRAVAVRPDNALMRTTLGEVLLLRGEPDRAEAELRKSLEVMQYSGTYYDLGEVMRAKGRIEESLEYYAKAMELDPNLPEAHFGAGISFYDLRQYGKAEECFRNVISLTPGLGIAHSMLGATLGALGRPDEAAVEYQNSLAIAPTSEAWNNLGVLKEDRGSLEEAARCYRQALAMDPQNAAASHNLTLVMAKLQKSMEPAR